MKEELCVVNYVPMLELHQDLVNGQYRAGIRSTFE